MAIRIDRDNRKDAHAHRMKRNQRIAPRGSKDVLRFAPNFSVYVLPPDSVCLYSEDRKFFLHGELYCALASAIAEDGKSVRALVRDLEQKFPLTRSTRRSSGSSTAASPSRNRTPHETARLRIGRASACHRKLPRRIFRTTRYAFSPSTCRVGRNWPLL